MAKRIAVHDGYLPSQGHVGGLGTRTSTSRIIKKLLMSRGGFREYEQQTEGDGLQLLMRKKYA